VDEVVVAAVGPKGEAVDQLGSAGAGEKLEAVRMDGWNAEDAHVHTLHQVPVRAEGKTDLNDYGHVNDRVGEGAHVRGEYGCEYVNAGLH
jgi:hypothetical protein